MIRLRFERQRRNLSQAQLAASIGADQSDYCKWELGHATPSQVALGRLAEVLGLPPEVDLLRPVEIIKPESRPRDPKTGCYVKAQR